MLNKKQIKAFLGIFFLLSLFGYAVTQFDITLYGDSYGNFEWEEFFTDDTYIYQAMEFRDIHYSNNGLKGIGVCDTDENGKSGVYAFIAYDFTSETKIKKTFLDISAYSASEQCAVKIFVNDNLIEFFLGEKTIDITEYTENKTSFSLKLEFWIINCTYDQDLLIQHLKLVGESEIPPEETPEPFEFEQTEDTEPQPEKMYYRLSEYIRDASNPSLQRHGARCIHGWLYLIKITTGVVI